MRGDQFSSPTEGMFRRLRAWEHDPDMYIENNAIMGRDPEREKYEATMVQIFERLRDSVKAIPRLEMEEAQELCSQVGAVKFEKHLSDAIEKVKPQASPGNAREFLHLVIHSAESNSINN
jgi:hypothetical protein